MIDALERTFNNDEVIDVRLAAAGAMLDIDPDLGSGLVVPLAELLRMMEPDSGQSPAWAARLLGRIGPQASSADAALTGLLNHKLPNVRVAAAEALVQIKPDRKAQSVALLRDLLQQEQPATRMAAVKALWRLSHEDAQKIATMAAELLDAERAEDAARLLGEMGPDARSALPRLRQVVESVSNRATRRAAWRAIEAIRGATPGE